MHGWQPCQESKPINIPRANGQIGNGAASSFGLSGFQSSSWSDAHRGAVFEMELEEGSWESVKSSSDSGYTNSGVNICPEETGDSAADVEGKATRDVDENVLVDVESGGRSTAGNSSFLQRSTRTAARGIPKSRARIRDGSFTL